MKRKITLGVLALLLLGAGCERTELAKDADMVELAAVDTSANEYRITRGEALGALRVMLQCVDGTDTRGARNNRLAGISEKDLRAVGSVRTRGGAPQDTLLYYLNLSGDGGYAILPADRRLGELPLVVTEQGYITAEDFAAREADVLPPLDAPMPSADGSIDSGYVVDNMDGNINRDVTQLVMRYACAMHMREPKKFSDGPEDEECEVIFSRGQREWGSKVGPLVTTKRHQDAPFNDWCPIKTNDEGDSHPAPAGPVTIAVAQILAYHCWPDGREWWGVPVNWDTVRTVCHASNKTHKGSAAAQVQAAALAREIGNQLNIRYGFEGSGATDFMARWYLKHLGFRWVERHCGVDESRVARLLNDGRLVYVSDASHAWLIDGYIEPKRTNTRTYVCPYDTSQYSYEERGHIRVHCNFGWNGASDGYYFPGIFDTNAGPVKINSAHAPSTQARTKGSKGDYSKNIHTITYW